MEIIPMSGQSSFTAVFRTGCAVVASLLVTSPASAQAALGTPFIGANSLSLYSGQITRSGGPDITHTFGVVYGRRFRGGERRTHATLVLRASARPFDDVEAGVLDAGASLALSHRVEAVPGLSLAGSAGLGVMAWGDDLAKTGRHHLSIPATAGASYAIRLGSATLAPFASASLARYNIGTWLDDVRQTTATGWDGYYTLGASLALRELILSSSRVVGEHGMPTRSRWLFTAGVSF